MSLNDPNTPEPIKIGARTYMMKIASTAERTRWRRNVAAAGGRKHGVVSMLHGLAAGVRFVMKDSPAEIRDGVLATIDAQRERVSAYFEAAKAMNGDDAASLAAFNDAGIAMNEGDAGLAVIAAEVTEAYPAYGQMVADESMYLTVCGLEALRMFCVGWEGLKAGDKDVICQRGPGGLTEAALAEVPESDLPQIGQDYMNLISVTPQQRKNLLSPQSSSPAGEILTT